MNQFQRNAFNNCGSDSSSKNNNLRDQKTPNGYPNSFLYRAHLNIDDIANGSNNAGINGFGAGLSAKMADFNLVDEFGLDEDQQEDMKQ